MGRGAPKGRAGTIGTSMTPVRRKQTQGPRLRLPKPPTISDLMKKKNLLAMAAQCRAEGREQDAVDWENTESYEKVWADYRALVTERRAAHAERQKNAAERQRATSQKNNQKKQEELAYMREHGISFPPRRR